MLELQHDIHAKVIRFLDTRNTGDIHNDENRWKKIASGFIEKELAGTDLPRESLEALRTGILDELFAFGPITPFLADPDISEIMVNGPDSIYLERSGRIVPAGVSFSSGHSLRGTIDRIVSSINRRLDESSPFADARLPDGSRVNAIIPPVSLSGPCLTIRKFRPAPFSLDELVRLDALSSESANYLKEAISRKSNIIVSGGTGSGKTTLLNALSQFIPEAERIITIEDAAEIRLLKPHVVRLEARPANVEGSGHVSIRDLVRNSLRMRPDRIIVGECRGAETLDMLQAMNTGHDGSITTGHANSPRDMLRRLETMVLLGGVEIPAKAIREQIASAIDLVVHVARMSDGSRRVTSITEVTGMGETQILLQELFRRPRSCAGISRLLATGIPSRLRDENDGDTE